MRERFPSRIRLILLSLLALALAAASGCGRHDSRGTAPLGPGGVIAGGATSDPSATRISLPFDPANFTNGIPNPYFPLVPGMRWIYRQETPDGVEIDTVEVTHDTKVILGVTTFVVIDRVYLDGALKEDTKDWYAPDKDGNVWYFGEDTRETGPPPTTAGSWEAGQDGAQAGIIMLAHPRVGDTYYQENAPGVVADQARVKGLNETAVTPFDTFSGCVKTQEWTPLEPGNRAFKFYAPGFGNVLEVPNQGAGNMELISFTRP